MMSWNYEEMYEELLKVDPNLIKEDILRELARIEPGESPSLSFKRGQELWDYIEYNYGFAIPVHFYTGDDLRDLCAEALKLNKRDAYYELEEYCKTPMHSKIGVIFGLRTTGKTVIMQQLAGREEHLHETAFATLTYNQCMVRQLEGYIKTLQSKGIKYIFIDEICYADGFVDYCAGIVDRFPSMKIIVSGTDSLSFYFAGCDAWYHRTVMFSTTWMSYPEFNRVLGGGILAYLKHGGVFEPTNYELDKYILSSVIDNIYNTVVNMDKDSVGKLIIESMSRQELYNIVYAISISITIKHIYKHASLLWGKKFAHGLNNALKSNGITVQSKDMDFIINKAYPYEVVSSKYDREVVDAVIKYLQCIEYLADVPIVDEDGKRSMTLVITQPRVLRSFTEDVITAIANTSLFTREENEAIINELNNQADGVVLEAVVATSVIRAKQSRKFKLRAEKYRTVQGESEIDLVVDYADQPLMLIEVKRSDKIQSKQVKNLCDPITIDRIKKIYGTHNFRLIVLYRGKAVEGKKKCGDYFVEYLNIEEFLLDLEKL